MQLAMIEFVSKQICEAVAAMLVSALILWFFIGPSEQCRSLNPYERGTDKPVRCHNCGAELPKDLRKRKG